MAAAAEPAAPAGAKRKRDDDDTAAAAGRFPAEWAEAEAGGDAAWWGRLRLVDVALSEPMAVMLASQLRKCNGRVQRVQRVRHGADPRGLVLHAGRHSYES